MQRPLRSIEPAQPADGAQTLAPVAPPQESQAGAAAAQLRRPAPPSLRDVLCIDSGRLFAGTTEVQIEHHGVTYRLKQTALGKLILTK